MATLKELYTTLESLRDMNLPVDEKLLKAADNLEEQIIKEEILPSLSQTLNLYLMRFSVTLCSWWNTIPASLSVWLYLARLR